MLLSNLLNKIISTEEFYKNPRRIKELDFLQNEYELDFKEAVLFSIIVKLYFSQRRFRGVDVGDLLEELEKFDGVFIGTTNLIENMDDAFNRKSAFRFDIKSKRSQFE